MERFDQLLAEIEKLDCSGLYGGDFLLTWEKSLDEVLAVIKVAGALRDLRERGISPRIFDSGLAVSIVRDNSTLARFSFAGACNLLGLEVRDFDEGKSQIVHGETVRETANMVSFMADVIGIRDSMYIGKGNSYMREVGRALDDAFAAGTLEQRPAIVNLQCDIDHPTQSMADMLHIAHRFGGLDNLRGKTIAMTWAYSPTYGKPLSVPQGVVGLMTRFGMNVRLAHPPGYEIMPEVIAAAQANARSSGGSFEQMDSMGDAFRGADIVYPKSWAPFEAMQQRTKMVEKFDYDGIKSLENDLLSQNARHRSWLCGEEIMKTTANGRALYMHCLPADITGVSCSSGEVMSSVFSRYRDQLYKEAGFKPYVIAAMIYLAKIKRPAATLANLESRGLRRVFE